jgi:hypothetical protein
MSRSRRWLRPQSKPDASHQLHGGLAAPVRVYMDRQGGKGIRLLA